MTIHIPQCLAAVSKRLVLAKRKIITSLAFTLEKDISNLSPAADNFPEGCIWFSLQELNSLNRKNNDDEKLPVVGNTPVIDNYVEWVLKLFQCFFSFSMHPKRTSWSPSNGCPLKSPRNRIERKQRPLKLRIVSDKTILTGG